MNRKPRVIRVPDVYEFDVYNHPDAIVDDLIIDDNKRKIEVRFVEHVQNRHISAGYSFGIYRGSTIDCDDPFDYYSNLLDYPDAVDFIKVDPSNAAVRTRYPWMNAFWYVVNIQRIANREISFVVEFSLDSAYEYRISVANLEADIAEVHRRFADFNAVKREMFVRWTDASVATWNDVQIAMNKIHDESDRLRQLDQRTCNVYDCNRRWWSLVITFDTRYHAQLEPFLRFLPGTQELLPLQHYIDCGMFDNRTGCFLGARRYQPRESQWLTYHRIILDLSIALAVLEVAPYVLLEVLHWLPRFLYWRESRKIELIMAIQRSMRAIRERRQPRRSARLQSIRARTDAK